MNLANLLTVGIASLTALAIALPNLKAQSPQSRSRVLTMTRYLTIKGLKTREASGGLITITY